MIKSCVLIVERTSEASLSLSMVRFVNNDEYPVVKPTARRAVMIRVVDFMIIMYTF
jgi:hypothetical protein